MQEVVSRESVLCRHEHLWGEKRPEAWTRDEDWRLLRMWVFGARLTMASLSFVFKKLTDMVILEMQRFERAKHLRLRLLLDKCRRCVELQKLHDPGVDQSLVEGEVKFLLGEVQAIFEAVPAYFLRELIGESSEPPLRSTSSSFAKPTLHRYGSTCTQLANRLVDEELTDVEHKEPEVFDFLAKHARQHLASVKEDALQKSTSRGLRRSASMGAASRSANGFCFEKQKDPAAFRIQRAAARCNNETVTLAEEEELDGRISEKEFERLLIRAGITWLTRSQQRLMFESLDQDQTGRLSLGEVLSTAGRIMELMHRATAYREEHYKDKPVQQAEFLREFFQTLHPGWKGPDSHSVDSHSGPC